MCGIAGVLHADRDHPVGEARLAGMVSRLRHRGPDDDGSFREGPCGLVHTRLAVLDPTPRAHQPMASADGRFVLTYNGEIYNFRELRDELRAAGHEFRTGSDTEVILELASRGGAAALERLEGMFAFALYDRELGELMLVRDRTGIKPLFWVQDEEGIEFASEPKALARGARGASPDAARIAEYLAFRHLAEEECLAPGVRTLPPGHRLVTNGRKRVVEAWWRPDFAGRADGRDTDAIVARAVERQLVSDVPVGTFLSGGVDSALVTAAASEVLDGLDTFTVGFPDPEWDETSRAAHVSGRLGVRAHVIGLEPAEYVAALGEAVWHLDAPLNHAHSVHLLRLARFARRHITVALTGEGSDELFGGYPRYRLFLMGRWLRLAPASLTRGLARALRGRRRLARLLEAADPDVDRAIALNAAFVPTATAAALAGLAEPDALLAPRRGILAGCRARGLDDHQSLSELERRTYLVSLLQRMDRMTMAAGLEARVPLLDESMLAFAAALPRREKLDLRESKKPMRRAAERRFGREHARAPKFGFGVPIDDWLAPDGVLGPLLARLLGERETRERGWLDVGLAGRLLAEHQGGAADHTEALWGVLNLELYARVCVEGRGAEAVAS